MKNRSVLSFYEAHKDKSHFMLSDDNISLSQHEIGTKKNKISRLLLDEGIKSGDTVGVYCGKTVDQIISMLAIWEVGAIYVPLSPLNPPDRINSIVKNAKIPLILSVTELIKDLDPLEVCKFNCHEVYTKAMGSDILPINVGPIAYIIYTSGTTGTPKGVVISHESLFHLMNATGNYFQELNENSILLQMVDFSFDVSLWDIALWLKKGCHLRITNHVHNIFNLIKTIETSRANYLCFPSPTFSLLVKLKDHLQKENFSFVKSVITTASYCSPQTALEILDFFSQAQVYNCYGPTEVTVYCTWTKLKREEISLDLPLTIGKPISGLAGYFYKDGRTFPYLQVLEREEAELCIAGPQVFLQYFNAVALTQEKLIEVSPGIFAYRTGDAVFRIQDNIYYLGRLDDCLKINGFRVHLGEIELALKSYKKVQDAVVLVSQKNDQDIINAFFSTKDGQDCLEDELKEYLGKKLTTYMMPKKYFKVEQFPLSAAGKIDKKQVRAIYLT